MTLREAIKARIWKVRKSIWAHPDDHLELQPTEDLAHVGPWATLHSPAHGCMATTLHALGRHNEANAATELQRQTVMVLGTDFDADEWEAYDPAPVNQ